MIVEVRVKPNAREQRIVVGPDGLWTISLRSPPVDGKANAELVSLIAKHLQVPKDAVRIRTGATGRRKRVEIATE